MGVDSSGPLWYLAWECVVPNPLEPTLMLVLQRRLLGGVPEGYSFDTHVWILSLLVVEEENWISNISC